MLPYNSWVSRVAFGVFFLILIGYGYYEARGILYGPQIQVPDSIEPVHEQFVRIQGTAIHIASLALNGKQVAVTETGAFNEPYLLAPGTNRVTLDAKDKYGNTAQRVLQIVYIPRPMNAPVHASSTPLDNLPATSSTSTSPSASSSARPSQSTTEGASSTPRLAH